MEVQQLPLADCGRYGDTCRECILSRDPYCGWDRARRRCIAVPPGYNVTTGYDRRRHACRNLLTDACHVSTSTIFFILIVSFSLPNRALIQNLDFSNSSVCGEAAGESLSVPLLKPELEPDSNQMIMVWLSGVQKPEAEIRCILVKTSSVRSTGSIQHQRPCSLFSEGKDPGRRFPMAEASVGRMKL